MMEYKPVRQLPPSVARKIAAGEVIDRPSAVVRELMDNAIDAGATRIHVEIANGGIDLIRVTDNGSGMTAEDLALCTRTHTTSKISEETDLLRLSTLGFRGEALSSIDAVSRLEIRTSRENSGSWILDLGNIRAGNHPIGTSVSVEGLFENFPARKQFLKRSSAESSQCRQIFIEKALAWPGLEFKFSVDGETRFLLPPAATYLERTLAALEPKEPDTLFSQIHGVGDRFTFSAVLGSPDVVRADRRFEMIFINGRRIMEYSLLQALEYGCEGHFPNGSHPVACLFIDIDPSLVDFNIHPAKREARFRDPGALHHSVSSVVKDYYRRYAVRELKREEAEPAQDFIFPSDGTREHPLQSRSSEPLSKQEAFFAPKTYAEYALSAGTHPHQAAAERESPIPESEAQDFRYLGQVLGTFLAVEKRNIFYLIDQHAAHERILYQELMETRHESQNLLIPYRIEPAGETDTERLRRIQRDLADAGFDIEEESDGAWQVASVPSRWVGKRTDLIGEILDPAVEPESLVTHLYATAACRAACKDGDVLDSGTAMRIIRQAFELEEPLCPHGRPLWIMMDREELFRKIRRT
ncbi:DNA mismatch repair endonuclease MutL [Treponema zuelzerae]|uniref:DNA mismatch repair protein MutL n=2 Tax=Teretinema zuelzerae TaxID=156 RepID=A0AAE3EFB8_9SPIR|nr:DNA mismatch repair endonuclease MutL [Teretinema zuelzerae]